MTPREKLISWWDERTDRRAHIRERAIHGRAVRASWARTLAPLVVALFAAEAITGVALMTGYAPDARDAWASVHFLTFRLPGGWLVRGLHHAASDALIVVALALVVESIVSRRYRKPGEVAYWAGLLTFLLVLLLAVTGRALPWDQFGYWARQVELNIVSGVPGGSLIQAVVQGGSEMGTLTLLRFFALHVALLPFLLLVVLRWRQRLVWHVEAQAATSFRGSASAYGQAARNIALMLGLTVVLFAWVIATHGAWLDAPADPTSDYPARPEWYLLPLFELRHLLHGPKEILALAAAQIVVGGLLVMTPLVDRSREDKPASRARRLLTAVPLALFLLGTIALGAISSRDDARDAAFQKSKTKAEQRATTARALAMNGVPPEGALAMLQNDPELRGEAIFTQSCAACHALGELGDIGKANAPSLDGWGTEAWIAAMLHDPDHATRFGKTPYKAQMPSLDTPPATPDPDAPPFKAMSADDLAATAAFLASQADEPGESPAQAAKPSATRQNAKAMARGESIVTNQCTSCHLWKGQGDDGGQGLAPELSGYGSVAWVRAQVANPSSPATYRDGALDPEKKGHMPRFDGDLSARDVDVVARWTRTHARSTTPR